MIQELDCDIRKIYDLDGFRWQTSKNGHEGSRITCYSLDHQNGYCMVIPQGETKAWLLEIRYRNKGVRACYKYECDSPEQGLQKANEFIRKLKPDRSYRSSLRGS